MRSKLWLGFIITASTSLPQQTQNQASYAIADSREVRDLFRDAEEHFQHLRWAQGLSKLQQVIEEFPNDLLPSAEVKGVYLGAAQYAQELIFNLAPEAREIYESNFGTQARGAFEEALAKRDPAGLRKVVQRFGMTRSGHKALLVLGDLALEKGDLHEAKELFEKWLRVDSKPDPQDLSRVKSLLEDVLNERSANRSLNFADEEAQGFTVPRSNKLSSAPSSLQKFAWRFPEKDGEMERPFEPDSGVGDPAHNLHPTVWGETAYFTDSVQAFALDLYSGKLLWRYFGAAGWSRISDHERQRDYYGNGTNPNVSVAGAASGGVCVFPLQVPLKLHENETFQGIPIRTIIPTRRLFALDSASGKMLWNHWRPELARLGAGEFVDRSSVAAPPLISGDRIYAPMYRMEGKIDFYLCCFDLRTGKMQWKTPIVSGQLELNMFGRPIREFAGSPLLLRDGEIYFSTNLGVIGCVEASHGQVQWIAPYTSLPIEPAVSYQRNPRPCYWANQPPVLDEGSLYVTPLDSQYLYAINAKNGELIYPLPYNRDKMALRHFLGVADGKLILCGNRIVALASKEGLGVKKFAPLWDHALFAADYTRSSLIPRGVLTSRSAIVPTLDGVASFRLEDGSLEDEPTPWLVTNRDLGNLEISNGVLISLSEYSIQGRLDWSNLLQETRRLSLKGDSERLERWGRLLRRRGESLAQGSRSDKEQALRVFEESSQVLEKLLEGGKVELGNELAELYSSMGELERTFNNLPNAENDFRQARLKATTVSGKLSATLRLAEVLSKSGTGEALEAVLEELERNFPAERRKIEGEGDIPISLHVKLQRFRFHSSQARWADALSDLQAMLRLHGSESLESGTVSEFAREEIGKILEMEGGRALYEIYEKEAAAMLERAVSLKNRNLFLEMIRLYPNANSVTKAYRMLAEIALDEGDTETILLVFRHFLEGEKDPTAQASLIRRLAVALEKEGNSGLSRCFLNRLADQFGELRSDYGPDEQKKYSSLKSAQPPEPSNAGPKPPFSPQGDFPLAYNTLHLLKTQGSRPESLGLLLAAADNELRCYRPLTPKGLEQPVWRVLLDPEEITAPSVVLFGNHSVLSSGRSLQGLDLLTGQRKWVRTLPSSALDCWGERGLFVVLYQEKRGSYQLLALDGVQGHELWSRHFQAERAPGLVFGEESLAVMSSEENEKNLQVIDLLTGEKSHSLTVPKLSEIQGAFIQKSYLCAYYPQLLRRNSGRDEKKVGIQCFPLEDGKASTRIAIPDSSEIHSFLGYKGRVFVVLNPRDPRDEEGSGLAEINAEEGSLKMIQSFARGTFYPGLIAGEFQRLKDPEFIALYPESKGFLKAVVIDLDTGTLRWKRLLPQPSSQTIDRDAALAPVWTSEILFLPLKMHRPNGTDARVEVMVLDRKTSETVSSSFSISEFPSGLEFEMFPLPGALIVQQGLSVKVFQGGNQ